MPMFWLIKKHIGSAMKSTNHTLNSAKKPIAFFVYNRPELTLKTFSIIQQYRPEVLFIIADGAKYEPTSVEGIENLEGTSPPKNLNDIENIHSVREICNAVDWPCAAQRLYRDKNYGCRESIVQGLTWVFNQTEQCIILEDDCLPNITFFDFCAELLDRYHDNDKVFTIGGHRPEPLNDSDTNAYYFSKYPSTWGWATWKRAFEGFDPKLNNWSEETHKSWLSDHLGNPVFAHYWSYMLNNAKKGANHWDYAWAYHCWQHDALSIRPSVNLIQNIGFGSNATHTQDATHPFDQLKAGPIPFPLMHASNIDCSKQNDDGIEGLMYSGMRLRQLKLFNQLIKQNRRLGCTE